MRQCYDGVVAPAVSVCGMLGDGPFRKRGMALNWDENVTSDTAQVLVSSDAGWRMIWRHALARSRIHALHAYWSLWAAWIAWHCTGPASVRSTAHARRSARRHGRRCVGRTSGLVR